MDNTKNIMPPATAFSKAQKEWEVCRVMILLEHS